MQTLRHDFWTAWTLVLLLAALSGCSKAQHAATADAPTQASTKKHPDTAQQVLPNMVSAVGAGKSSATIDLKFELRERPVVGEPVDIDLALIPGHDLDRLYATFQATDGLELTKGGKTDEIDHPSGGVPIPHTVTIVPQRDGIFYVSAIVLADSSAQSVTRSFSIPVIAGAGISVPGAAPVAAPGAAPRPAQAR